MPGNQNKVLAHDIERGLRLEGVQDRGECKEARSTSCMGQGI